MLRSRGIFFLVAMTAISLANCKSTNRNARTDGALKTDGAPGGSDSAEQKKMAGFINSIRTAVPSPITLGKCQLEFVEVENPEAEDDWYKVYNYLKIKVQGQRDDIFIALNGSDKMYEGGVFAKDGSIVVENTRIDIGHHKNQKAIIQFDSTKYAKITQISIKGWYWANHSVNKNDSDWAAEINDKCVK